MDLISLKPNREKAKSPPGLDVQVRTTRTMFLDPSLTAVLQKDFLQTRQPDHNSSGIKHGFLTLPGELRNRIYEFSIYPNQSKLFCAHHTGPEDIFRSLLRLPIYRVNRQVRNEALSFLCASKTFTCLNISAAATFLQYIGPSGRASLNNFELLLSSIWTGHEMATEFLNLLQETVSLKKFHLCFALGIKGDAYNASQWEFFARLGNTVQDIKGAQFTWGIKGFRALPDNALLPKEVDQCFGLKNWESVFL